VGNQQRGRCGHLNDDEVHDESYGVSGARSVRVGGEGSMTDLTVFERRYGD
jgi:hypothetical protein